MAVTTWGIGDSDRNSRSRPQYIHFPLRQGVDIWCNRRLVLRIVFRVLKTMEREGAEDGCGFSASLRAGGTGQTTWALFLADDLPSGGRSARNDDARTAV